MNVAKDHTNQHANPSANPSVPSKIKSKVRKNSNDQSAVGNKLSAGIGESLAVTYDSAAKDRVTLGGTGAISPVMLHNVDTGEADTDGVNVAQLTSGLTELREELSNGAIDLKYIKVSSTGAQANANGANAVSIGSAAHATANGSVAIGTGARASGMNAVAVGFNALANLPNTFSVGSPGNARKVINVANGEVSDGSTDAVNGGQLFAALNTATQMSDLMTKMMAEMKAEMQELRSQLGKRA